MGKRTGAAHPAEESQADARRGRLRQGFQPTGGPRLALSYAVWTVAGLVGLPIGLAIAGWLYNTGRVCHDSESLGCPVLTAAGWGGGLALLVLVAGALGLRLGWRWLLLGVGLLSGVIQATALDVSSWWWAAAVLIPLPTSILTDPGDWGGRRWRRLAAVVVGLALLAWFATSIALAMR